MRTWMGRVVLGAFLAALAAPAAAGRPPRDYTYRPPKRAIPKDMPAAIRKHVERLRAPLPRHRAEAADALAAMGPRADAAVEFLRDLMLDKTVMVVETKFVDTGKRTTESLEMSCMAADAIWSVRSREIASLVLAAEPELRLATAKWLARRAADPVRVEHLLTAMGDTKADIRAAATAGMFGKAHPRAMEALFKALRDASPEVRRAAAHALGGMGHLDRDRTMVMPLVDVLSSDGEAACRAKAAEALGRLRDRRAVDALMAAMKDTSSPVRESAAAALAKVSDPRVRDRLRALDKQLGPSARASLRKHVPLRKPTVDREAVAKAARNLKSPDPQARLIAVECVARDPDPYVEALIEALDDAEGQIRHKAVTALAKASGGNRRAAEAMLAVAATGKSPRGKRIAKYVAFAGLARLGGPTAVAGLEVALAGESADVKDRLMAANALGQIGTPKAVKALRAARGDKNELLRRRVQRLLTQQDTTSRPKGLRRPATAPAAPAAAPAPAKAAAAPAPSTFRLGGVMSGPNGRIALINGRTVAVGQSVGGAKVVRIDAFSVDLESAGRRFTVRR